MITIKATNGREGSGETVAEACRALAGHQTMTVRVGRAHFVPVEEATVAQMRHSGAIWVLKDRSWSIAALLAEVAET